MGAKRKIEAMHALFGRSPRMCADCMHFSVQRWRSGRYFKCDAYSNSCSAASDWRKYYPARDTDQTDLVGYRICSDNRAAIEAADKIAVFFDKMSQGSLFDLGMAFAMHKPIMIVNDVEPTAGKSFCNMILEWANRGDTL